MTRNTREQAEPGLAPGFVNFDTELRKSLADPNCSCPVGDGIDPEPMDHWARCAVCRKPFKVPPHPSALALREVMLAISEWGWSAVWLNTLAYDLWERLQTDNRTPYGNLGYGSPEGMHTWLQTLRLLGGACDGWWDWQDAYEDGEEGEPGHVYHPGHPIFLPMTVWEARFQRWIANRIVEPNRPRTEPGEVDQ